MTTLGTDGRIPIRFEPVHGESFGLFGHNRRWSYANACSCGSLGVTNPQVR
jgi:hypothetical protein